MPSILPLIHPIHPNTSQRPKELTKERSWINSLASFMRMLRMRLATSRGSTPDDGLLSASAAAGNEEELQMCGCGQREREREWV